MEKTTVHEFTESGERIWKRKSYPGLCFVKMNFLTDREAWQPRAQRRGATGLLVGSDGKGYSAYRAGKNSSIWRRTPMRVAPRAFKVGGYPLRLIDVTSGPGSWDPSEEVDSRQRKQGVRVIVPPHVGRGRRRSIWITARSEFVSRIELGGVHLKVATESCWYVGQIQVPAGKKQS